MPDSVTPFAPSEAAPNTLGRRRLRVTVLAIVVVSLATTCGVVLMRPLARVNRLLTTVGLAHVPASARDVRLKRRGRLLGTRILYLRFEASAETIARFVENSPMTTVDEPTPMATIRFGPRSPKWMDWKTGVQGRMYHWMPDETSVWLAIDDDTQTVYIGVYEPCPTWLSRFFN